MCTRSMGRSITLAFGAAALLGSSTASMAASPRIERHFVVNGRPVVVIQNVANGRIEVKSSKSQEVAVIATQNSNKINFEMEQAGDRIDVTANVADASAPHFDLETSLQLKVPD